MSIRRAETDFHRSLGHFATRFCFITRPWKGFKMGVLWILRLPILPICLMITHIALCYLRKVAWMHGRSFGSLSSHALCGFVKRPQRPNNFDLGSISIVSTCFNLVCFIISMWGAPCPGDLSCLLPLLYSGREASASEFGAPVMMSGGGGIYVLVRADWSRAPTARRRLHWPCLFHNFSSCLP